MELRPANHCVYRIRYHMVFLCEVPYFFSRDRTHKRFEKMYVLKLVKDTVLSLIQLVVMVTMYIFLLELNQSILL